MTARLRCRSQTFHCRSLYCIAKWPVSAGLTILQMEGSQLGRGRCGTEGAVMMVESRKPELSKSDARRRLRHTQMQIAASVQSADWCQAGKRWMDYRESRTFRGSRRQRQRRAISSRPRGLESGSRRPRRRRSSPLTRWAMSSAGGIWHRSPAIIRNVSRVSMAADVSRASITVKTVCCRRLALFARGEALGFVAVMTLDADAGHIDTLMNAMMRTKLPAFSSVRRCAEASRQPGNGVSACNADMYVIAWSQRHLCA